MTDIRLLTAIQLGNHETPQGLGQAFEEAGCVFGRRASSVLEQPAFSVYGKLASVDVVSSTVAGLTFPDGTQYGNILQYIQVTADFEVSPSELGLQLCLQPENQPSGEKLFVVMEPIHGKHNGSLMFVVKHNNDKHYLSVINVLDGTFFSPDDRLVFIRCQQ